MKGSSLLLRILCAAVGWRFTVLICCLLVFGGCKKASNTEFAGGSNSQPNAKTTDQSDVMSQSDLAVMPKLLLDPNVAVEKLSINGVRLGDVEALVAKNALFSPRDSQEGYLMKSGHGGLVVQSGRVAEIWIQSSFHDLGIGDISGLSKSLGAPIREVDLGEGTKVYLYESGNIRVTTVASSDQFTVTISNR